MFAKYIEIVRKCPHSPLNHRFRFLMATQSSKTNGSDRVAFGNARKLLSDDCAKVQCLAEIPAPAGYLSATYSKMRVSRTAPPSLLHYRVNLVEGTKIQK
jgi:hypothetical protein